ncbi:MAG: M48 family metalloprotease [Candidatus Omnitrophica bacterium]|nr:M48 family metalloprotease [Candidatus Omnitrophota bacterium]
MSISVETFNFLYCTILFILIAWHGFSKKSVTIDLSESSIRIILAYIVTGLIMTSSLITIAHSTFILNMRIPTNHRLLLAALPCLILVTTLLVSLVRLSKYLKKIIRTSKDYEDAEIVEKANDLSDAIGLPKAPTILFAKEKNRTPEVQSYPLLRKSFVIFPSNLRQYIERFMTKETGIEPTDANWKKHYETFRDFIILHELSHIKNKDTSYWTHSSSLITQSILWFLASVILSAHVYFGKINKFGISPLTSISGIALLFLLTASFRRTREYLSDASAMLYLSYSKSNLLSQKKPGTNKTLIETFLNWHEHQPETVSPSRGPGFSSLNRLAHPSHKKRSEAITKQEYISPKIPYPTNESIIFIAILNVILTYALLEGIGQFFTHFMPLKSVIDGWAGSTTYMIAFITPPLLSAMFLTLPIKNTISPLNNMNTYLKPIVVKTLIFTAISTLTFIFLGNTTRAMASIAESRGPYFFWFLTSFSALTVIAATLLLTLIISLVNETNPASKKLLKTLLAVTPIVIAFIVAPPLLLGFLFKPNYFLAIFSFVIAYGIWLRIPPKKNIIIWDDRSFYPKIFNRSICCEAKGHGILSRLRFAALIALFDFSIPLLLCIPIYLFLNTILDSNTLEFTRNLISASRSSELYSSKQFIILAVFFIGAFWTLYAREKDHIPSKIVNCSEMIGISELVQHKDFSRIYKTILAKTKNHLEKNKFVEFPNSNLETAYIAFCATNIIKHDTHETSLIKEQTTHFLTSLYNNKGGFGAAKGGEPRLRETYYAVEIISVLQTLKSIDKDKISEWIISCQNINDGNFVTPYFGQPSIEETFYAINTLNRLSSHIPNYEKCKQWLLTTWRKKADIENTFYLTSALPQLEPQYIEEITKKYLHINNDRFFRFRYDKDLRKIRMHLHIARQCYGLNSDEFKQLTKNTEEEIEKIIASSQF